MKKNLKFLFILALFSAMGLATGSVFNTYVGNEVVYANNCGDESCDQGMCVNTPGSNTRCGGSLGGGGCGGTIVCEPPPPPDK